MPVVEGARVSRLGDVRVIVGIDPDFSHTALRLLSIAKDGVLINGLLICSSSLPSEDDPVCVTYVSSGPITSPVPRKRSEL